jgi:hypothetical protein
MLNEEQSRNAATLVVKSTTFAQKTQGWPADIEEGVVQE